MPEQNSDSNRPVSGFQRLLGAAAGALIFVAAGLGMWYADTRKSGTSRIHAESGEGELLQLGRSVYGTHCATCHGRDLQGHPDWHPKGDMLFKPPPLDGTARHRSNDELFEIIGRGFSSTLTEREILATIEYLQFEYLHTNLGRLRVIQRPREQRTRLPDVDE